jgi:isoleucyl-tRNA synthetase
MFENKEDLQKTLNLPTTSFPMKANLSQREPQMLNLWQKKDVYEKMQKNNEKQPVFVLHDGPPYANGHIHIGHALNKILKDIIVKSKNFNGFRAPYIPGWDCHGLPIELNVEKNVGKPYKDISVIEFIHLCQSYAESQWEIQREEFKRLGVLGDWEHPYLTMDHAFEANIMRTLAMTYQQGFIEQGKKPVYWCLQCASSLAEAEVEYQNKKSPAIDVLFMVKNVPELLRYFGITRFDHHDEAIDTGVPIWTTTPWTLPANEAVSLHPEYTYVLLQYHGNHGTMRLILAHELVSQVTERYGIDHYEILGQCSGHALEGCILKHPFYDREVPIVLGEHVTLDTGTGAVHTAPAHGVDDYEIGQKYHLPCENYLNNHGIFPEHTKIVGGLHINAANDVIIETLENKRKLLHSTKLEHSYPHCWRHKKPLIFMATPQWFVSMKANQLREKTLAAIEQVNWIPEWGKNRIASMISQRPDWCISRQRTWGVPLAIFVHQHDVTPHPQTVELILKVADYVEKYGIEIWHALYAKELNIEISLSRKLNIGINQLKSDLISIAGEHLFNEYRPLPDVLDVWFNAGASYACILEKNESLQYPASLYLEGSDQHRGWFHTSLLSSMAKNGIAPYEQVLTHGFTVDEHGHKMSKSLGNVIAPEKIIKTYGADILRLWVASTDYRSEISISDQILQRIADNYRRIRNTARFLLANLFDFEKVHLIPFNNLLLLDQFIVANASRLQQEIIAHYEAYEFHLIYQKIHQFCSQDLGSFYLDIIKDRQYTMAKNSHGRRSAQSAIYHIIHALSRWLAPILSFTAEEIWYFLPQKPEEDLCSIFLTHWYTPLNQNFLPVLQQLDWPLLFTVRDAVNKQIEYTRSRQQIGAALEAEVILYGNEAIYNLLKIFKDELKFIFITSSAQLYPIEQCSELAIETEVPGLKLIISPYLHPKCSRCWHRSPDIQEINNIEIQLCGRCLSNIHGEGEKRMYV